MYIFATMRIVVQRTSSASVTVNGQVMGRIGRGLLALVGITHNDSPAEVEWMADKLLSLRIFSDDDGKMNRSVTDIGGGILVVSQFTLYGDLRKGTRPSFIDAARPEHAEPLYDMLVTRLRERGKDDGVKIGTGIFGAMMDVALVNDGPVTIILERDGEK